MLPHVLLGDFNIKPADGAYELLTAGSLPASHPDVPAPEVIAAGGVAWRPRLQARLRSAYAAAGSEPAWTNHTVSGGKKRANPFTDVLDYVFVSEDWSVEAVMPTPPATPPYPDHTYPLCPSAEEPSDHIMIGATLALL